MFGKTIRALAPAMLIAAITATATLAPSLAQGAPSSSSHLPERTPEQKEKDQSLADFAKSLGITLDDPKPQQKPIAEPDKLIATPPEPAKPAARPDSADTHDKACLAKFESYSEEMDKVLDRIDGNNQDSIAAGMSTYCGWAQAGWREMQRMSCPQVLIDGSKKQWDLGEEKLALHNGRNHSEYKCSR